MVAGKREEGIVGEKEKLQRRKETLFVGGVHLFNYIGSGKTAIPRGQNFQKNKFHPKEALN